MKRFVKLVLLVVLMAGGTAAMGQQLKFGYINSQELITLMPERDSAQAKMEKFVQEIQDQVEALQVELNNKFQKYQKEASTYTPTINEQKQKELPDLSNRLQEYQQAGENDARTMNMELMTPIFNKANEAINKVAAANGFTAIFDTTAGALLYYDPNVMVDILPMVKAELGITK